MPSPSVHAVVVHYRDPGTTAECVHRLRASDYPALDLLIVDNGSAESDLAALTQSLEGEEILHLSLNGGYGAAANAGMQAALSRGADYLWVVTPDTRVEPDCLSELVRAMEASPALGASGPYLRAGNHEVISWGLFPALGFLVWPRLRVHSKSARAAVTPTDFVEGGAMLLRAGAAIKVGGFRPEFFLYFEDCELSLRMRNAGWKLGMCPAARAGTRSFKEERNSRTYYLIRNSIALARLQRRHLVMALLRNVMMVPLRMVWRGYGLKEQWGALRDGTRLDFGNVPRLESPQT